MTIRPRPIAFEIAQPFLEKIAVSFGRLGPEGFFRALQSVKSRKNLARNLTEQETQLSNIKMAIEEGTLPRTSPIYEMLPADLAQVQNRQLVDGYLLRNINKELQNVSDQQRLLKSFESELKNIGPTPRLKRQYEYSMEAQRRAERARNKSRIPTRRLRAERESFPIPHSKSLIPQRDYRQLERELPLSQRALRATGLGRTVPEIVDEPLRRDYMNRLRAAEEIRGGRNLTAEEISRITDRLPEAPFDADTGRNLLRFSDMPRPTRQMPAEFDRNRLDALYQRELDDLQQARRQFAQYDDEGTLIRRSLPDDSFLSNQAMRQRRNPELFFNPAQGGIAPPNMAAAEATLPPMRRRRSMNEPRRPRAEVTNTAAGFTNPLPLESSPTATVRLARTETTAAPPFIPLDDILAAPMSQPISQPLRPIGQTGNLNPKFTFSGKMSQGTDPLKTFTGVKIPRK